MDPTKMLEADHRDVEDLFARIKKTEGKERMALIQELSDSLLAHMELEETVLYPAMKPVTGKDDVKEGKTEHDLARKTLEDVMKLAPDELGIGGAIDALEAGIAHHVEEEEDEVFPKLRSDGQQVLDDMATPFMTKRMELGLPMPAAALSAAFNKDELCAEAESAGVDGAADMKKDELAAALAKKMAS